jgi:hypothetical protein
LTLEHYPDGGAEITDTPDRDVRAVDAHRGSSRRPHRPGANIVLVLTARSTAGRHFRRRSF